MTFFFLFLGFYADPSTRESVLALVGFINLLRCSWKFIGFNFCGLKCVKCVVFAGFCCLTELSCSVRFGVMKT